MHPSYRRKACARAEPAVSRPHETNIPETRALCTHAGGALLTGRLGLFIHATAGFGDIGFAGYWTLEIFCIQPVRIYPDVEICQIYYHDIGGDFDLYASGKYQNNTGIQPSLMYRDFEKDE